MKLALVLISILLINTIFGYWRSNTRKLSLQWFFAIHIPVPIAIALRLLFLGWSWVLLPVFVAAFAVGQFIGGVTRRLLKKQRNVKLGSFLLTDVIRVLSAERVLDN